MQKSGKEKMVLVFIFPLVLIFLFSCSFPLEKNNRNNNEHAKQTQLMLMIFSLLPLSLSPYMGDGTGVLVGPFSGSSSEEPRCFLLFVSPILDWQQTQLMLMIYLCPHIWAMDWVSFLIVFCIFKRGKGTPHKSTLRVSLLLV